ncbi:hypothetical protein [uncultured Sphingomonas sp.]|uniref:hypothetical protein n=1 Tax=uncultured Sphingomonas sp. TaxID=158754 RepID=UPI0035CBC6EA
MAATQRDYTLREASNLICAEDQPTIERFVDLAIRTNEHLPSPEIFKMSTNSAFSGVVQMRHWKGVPTDVLRGWSDWKVGYEALRERNPRLDWPRCSARSVRWSTPALGRMATKTSSGTGSTGADACRGLGCSAPGRTLSSTTSSTRASVTSAANGRVDLL